LRSTRSSCALFCALVLLCASGLGAQQSQDLVLRGQVLVGDTTLSVGTVMLHEVTDVSQGEIDSVAVSQDGSFSFRLPAAPSRVEDRFYFASIRHAGILYFGSALAETAQLEAVYEIQAYDTLMVPQSGFDIPLQARNIFFEPNGEEWRVTDIFQIRNDEGRTLVASDEAPVWSYPLPPGARDFTSGQGELSLDGTSFEDGVVSVRAAIAPGERVFIFRYTVDDPFGVVPSPGNTELFDLLIREPAPRVGAEGLELAGRIELEAGSTYRRYSGVNIGPERVRLVQTQLEGDLPVEWITVLIGLALALAALFVMRTRGGLTLAGRPGAGGAPTVLQGREALLLEVAKLDEAFEAKGSPSDEERASYEARRAELLRRLRAGS
jgi:hypothetical protein